MAYLMDATALDPVRYDLLFDRFLTPGRKGFPDIDVDYPQSKRPDIKEYLAGRHRHDHVCGTGTRSRSGPNQTVRDLCRAMGINFADTKEMVALIEDIEGVEAEIEADLDGEPPTWEEVLEGRGSALAEWAGKYPDLFEKTNEMTGLVRQAGTHAAGVLIASQPLLLDWPLLVDWNFQVLPGPAEKHTRSGRRRDHATAKLESAAYIELIDLVISPLQGYASLDDKSRAWRLSGSRRHLLLG